ncbi:hypothetical protein PF007_g9938 [Phytophthora fragariae]|uniref:Uncharacterized protein n=1 Tax=Phytophthora fragariae TaxID=53985 RepID=A0A6A3SF11_9STRA|nr:hypothetical protein PF007_g9938 [Phytophthora fragariae]KAE9340975.1 hypothetical protein PF008_g10859 [Phytophthora fragariae]
METPTATFDQDREDYAGKKASLALQRALNGAGAWMVTTVRDQRKCDHALLPAEIPASIREKVAKILQDRGVKEQVHAEAPDPKAPWHQQLELHVARLMQQMRGQPHQFRQLLLMAASEPSADCVVSSSSTQSFVDSRRAYRRLRRAAMVLGEEVYYLVRAFVRRSEANGVLPQDAQAVRLASLYKLELRRHVTISAVMECIHQADCDPCASVAKTHGLCRQLQRRSTLQDGTRFATKNFGIIELASRLSSELQRWRHCNEQWRNYRLNALIRTILGFCKMRPRCLPRKHRGLDTIIILDMTQRRVWKNAQSKNSTR